MWEKKNVVEEQLAIRLTCQRPTQRGALADLSHHITGAGGCLRFPLHVQGNRHILVIYLCRLFMIKS